jgi:phosphoinositide-3-kinase regulatory subunit 4
MQSKIVILDVRTLRSIITYQQPNQIAPISCMCLDKKHAWLLTGTLSGFLTLWDLRFGLRLRTWKVGNEKTGGVQSCTIHSTKGRGRWVIVTLDNCEGFETWDIGTAQCVERFMLIHDLASKEVLRDLRRQRSTSTASKNSRTAGQVAQAVDDNPAQAIQTLLANANELAEARNDTSNEPQSENPAAALHGFQHRPNRPAINTILHGLDYAHASGASALSSLPTVVEMAGGSGQPARTRHADGGWIISAGEDRRLVFWDLSIVEKSSLIVGVEEGEDKATYGRENVEGTDIFTEIRSNGKGTANSSKRANLTAGSQQNLLRAHQDAITALALLELPFKCVVSADRSGNVKIWE